MYRCTVSSAAEDALKINLLFSPHLCASSASAHLSLSTILIIFRMVGREAQPLCVEMVPLQLQLQLLQMRRTHSPIRRRLSTSCRNGRKSKVARDDGELTSLGIWVANQRFSLFKGLVSADPYY